MKFFRWLLSNILLIIVVVGLIYTYVYWGRLTGSDTPGGEVITYLSGESGFVHNFVDGIKEKNRNRENRSSSNQHTATQLVTASEGHKSDHSMTAPSSTPAPSSTSGNHATLGNSPAGKLTGEIKEKGNNATSLHTQQNSNAGSVTPGVPLPEEAANNSNTSLSQQLADTKKENSLLQKKAHSLSAQAKVELQKPELQKPEQKGHSKIAKTGAFVSPDVEAKLEKAGTEEAEAALTPEAIRKVWIKARKSFYKHDYVQSEKDYNRVIAATKNNYNAYGELGNVYFYQGKNDKAADAYMKAALIMIDSGQSNRARSLLGLMHYLSKDKAKLLEQKLEAAQ